MHDLQTEHGMDQTGEYFFTQRSSWSVQPVTETHLGCCVWGLNCGPTLCYATFLCPSRHQYGLFLGSFQHSPWSFLCAHFHVHACLWFIAFVTQVFLKQVFISTAWDQEGSRQNSRLPACPAPFFSKHEMALWIKAVSLSNGNQLQ